MSAALELSRKSLKILRGRPEEFSAFPNQVCDDFILNRDLYLIVRELPDLGRPNQKLVEAPIEQVRLSEQKAILAHDLSMA